MDTKVASRVLSVLILIATAFTNNLAQAQQFVGRCFAPAFNVSYAMYSDGMIIQDHVPNNRGMGMRDPSGQAYLRLPSKTPHLNAYFVAWDGTLIELDYQRGVRAIGHCQIPIPPNPLLRVWQPPQYSYYIETPQGQVQVPQSFADTSNQFATPRIVSEQVAINCAQISTTSNGLNKESFGGCMLQKMITDQERKLIDCAQRGDQAAVAFCMVGQLGGTREKQIAAEVHECYRQFGSDYSLYPLCMVNSRMPEEASRLIACVEQQGRNGDITVMGTAFCYGANSIRMNPETQIIVFCAVATGGEPYSFAGCAGGQLTARELNKCFTDGIGGNGCFGRNNDIIKALSGTGQWLSQHLGGNNDLVRTWNQTVHDIQRGPGPNHAANVALRNVGNELSRGANNVHREIGKVFKGIKI